VTGVPLITHVHSTEYDRTGGNSPNPVVVDIEKEGLMCADRIVAISKLQKSLLVSNYGVDESKIDIIYNGASFFGKESFSPALEVYKKMGYKIVLFLGRITLQKGPEYFVRAARKVLDYEKKVLFVVTGDGDMFNQMLEEAVSLGVVNNFVFTGFLRGEEKDRIFQSADIYVMPSVSEPFGITVLESIGNGTPVLVSKQSGVSEVVQHALKADFWDVNEIANKIISSIRYPVLLQDLIRESKRELPGINWDKSADKCVKIYETLLANH